MTPNLETVFGNRTAARVAVFIEQNSEAYARQIASAFEISLSQVQKQLQRLEAGGILVSKTIGRIRLYRWNSRSALVRALREGVAYELNALIEAGDPRARSLAIRERPRRQGKPSAKVTAEAQPDSGRSQGIEGQSARSPGATDANQAEMVFAD